MPDSDFFYLIVIRKGSFRFWTFGLGKKYHQRTVICINSVVSIIKILKWLNDIIKFPSSMNLFPQERFLLSKKLHKDGKSYQNLTFLISKSHNCNQSLLVQWMRDWYYQVRSKYYQIHQAT